MSTSQQPDPYVYAPRDSMFWIVVIWNRNGWWARVRIEDEIFSSMHEYVEDALAACEFTVKQQLESKPAPGELERYKEWEKRLLAHVAPDEALRGCQLSFEFSCSPSAPTTRKSASERAKLKLQDANAVRVGPFGQYGYPNQVPFVSS